MEAIGLPRRFPAAVEEVAFTGRLVYIGYAKEAVAHETRLFVQKEPDVLGSRSATPDDFQQVIRMLEGGVVPVADAVSAVVPMEDAPRLLQAWSKNPGSYTKIMVRVN